jgi:GntR family transcriptional regulator, transcriptional repressor for pyruvate dehydrogenase complex
VDVHVRCPAQTAAVQALARGAGVPVSADSGWAPVRRVRTHEQVVAQIQEKILDGELRVGTKLPSERDLVEALGVSRSSVREALRSLEAMGIIDAQGGSGRDSGSVISGRSTQALGNLLRLHISLAEIGISDMIEVRIQLERHAASGAATHGTPEDVANLRRLVTAMGAPELTSAEFNELDTEFHVSIARASGNVLAATLMQALRDAVKSEMVAAFSGLEQWHSVGDQLVVEHAALVEAIAERRADDAAELVERHISAFYLNRLAGRPTRIATAAGARGTAGC